MREATEKQPVRAWGPASLSNLGPGFDTLGVCLSGIGDVVEVWPVEEPGVHVVPSGGVWESPLEMLRNTAARAAHAAWVAHGRHGGLAVRIQKGLLPGSGLGSSAASAVAGAWAVELLLAGENEPDRDGAIPFILEGERAASAAVHGDNVVPALMGGVVLVRSDDPRTYRRIPIPVDVHISVIRPSIRVLTEQARAVLPAQVPLADAVANASALAFLVDALRAGDLETAGEAMSRDRIVEPVRAALVPGLDAVKTAALEAGASGCALSGSGPAIFAISRDIETAKEVAYAMEMTASGFHERTASCVTSIDPVGARPAAANEPQKVI